MVVDAEALAHRIAGEHAEVDRRAVTMIAVERMRPEAATRTRVGEASDVALPVDRHRRVPGVTADVADVDRAPVLPQHHVLRGVATDRLIAFTGNADHLAAIVDRGGRAAVVAL